MTRRLPQQFRTHPAVGGLARWMLWILFAAVAVWAGLIARDRVFAATAPIRFHGDVNNAVRTGRYVLMDAVRGNAIAKKPLVPSWRQVMSSYLNVYDAEYARVANRPRFNDIDFSIDYPPGRLLVAAAWVKHLSESSGLNVRYSDANVAPLLWLNTAHELLAAAVTFAWFNPALLLEGHGWPQWDGWVLPYMLWAAYFGLINRWMAVGALLAFGSLFKGQVLLIAPLFALWPIFRGDLDALLRLGAGFAITFAVTLSPWLVWRAQSPAIVWLIAVLVLGARSIAWPRGRWSRASVAVDVLLVGVLCAAAWQAKSPVWLLAPAVAALAILFASQWRGRRFASFCVFATGVILVTPAWFGGSFAFLEVAFQTDRFPVMTMGNLANVPALLEHVYQLKVTTHVFDTPWFGWPIELRQLLRGLAFTGVGLSALAIALGQRRRDPNLLIGFAAAWTILYALLPQMHERYLLWGAVTSALLAARSIGGVLVHLALTAISVSMLLCEMIEANGRTTDPAFATWYVATKGMMPSAGYATLTLAIVLIVWSFRRSVPPREVVVISDTAGTVPASA